MSVNKNCTLSMGNDIVTVEELDWADCVASRHFQIFASALKLQ